MIGRLRTIAALAALALAAAIAGLQALPVLDRDEARFAQASVQMIESGDYVRINFQAEARNKKPAGIYWLQTVAVQTFSSPEARAIWAYRLPSVLGLLLAVIAAYGAGCIMAGRKAAFAGAALLAVGALAGVEAGIAKTDAMLMGVTTLAMAALAALYEGRRSVRLFSVIFWGAVAAGILVKGPVTPMIVGLAIVMLVAVDRQAFWLKPLLWWPGPLVFVLMIAPWVYLVQKATGGAFLLDLVTKDFGPKLISGHESHGGWPGTHLALTPLLFFPGVLFLVPGIVLVTRAFFHRPSEEEGEDSDEARIRAMGLRFLAAWALPAWIVFEIVPTKLVHYVLPLYPALALMAGAAFARFADRRALVASQLVSLVLFAAIGGFYAGALVLLPDLINTGAVLDPKPSDLLAAFQRQPMLEKLLPAIVAGILVVAPLTLWRAPMVKLGVAIAAGLALQWGARGVVAPHLETLWVSSRISETLEALSLHPRSPLARPPLVSAGYNEPSLIFLTDTSTVLTDGADAARYAAQEAGRATLVEAREREAFERELEDSGATAVIVAEVNGLNYSRGEPVSISIYRTTQRARRRPAEGEGRIE